MTKVMTTEQYSKDVYINANKEIGCSQQYIRKIISKGKIEKLNNVVKITQSGKYYLLEVKI